MNSFRLISYLVLLVTTLAFGKETRPNVIFLFTDDQASYSLGCYGNKDVKTPHIDSLSEAGMTFDHHYDTTAICMASRVNVMTGLYEYRHGCNFDHGPLTEKLWETSYPIRLRKSGYLTAFRGQVRVRVAPRNRQGFEVSARGRLRQVGRWTRARRITPPLETRA